MATTGKKRRSKLGHLKHEFYCSCGRVVCGNGGKQHFKLDGHKRVTYSTWLAARATAPATTEET